MCPELFTARPKRIEDVKLTVCRCVCGEYSEGHVTTVRRWKYSCPRCSSRAHCCWSASSAAHASAAASVAMATTTPNRPATTPDAPDAVVAATKTCVRARRFMFSSASVCLFVCLSSANKNVDYSYSKLLHAQTAQNVHFLHEGPEYQGSDYWISLSRKAFASAFCFDKTKLLNANVQGTVCPRHHLKIRKQF